MRHYFGFTREPFSPDIKVDELYHTAALEGAKERFLYAVNLGAISVITGDVGSGKSTALRYASSSLHPSQYQLISVVASTGSIIEVLKQICMALDVEWTSISLAKLTLVALCLLSGLLWPVGVDGLIGSAASAVRAPADERPAAAVYVETVHGRPTR